MSDIPDLVRQQFAAVAAGPHVVTIGNFDGLHRGHRALLKHLKDKARALDARTLVITFEPHPVSVLRPQANHKRLLPPDRKYKLLAELGIDDIAIVPFSMDFAAVGARDFLDLIRVQTNPVAIVVGEGFRFGHKREGDCDLLREYAATHEFEADILELVEGNGERFSSSSVRKALKDGRLTDAEAVLGRRYRLQGTVEHGAARGQGLGYPTANLAIRSELLIPADGIYAAYARIDDDQRSHPAMVYIGDSPTFESSQHKVEVNILDFNGDLYAKELEIEFVTFIRGDREFDSAEELVARMAEDERETRTALETHEPEADDWVRH